MPASVEEPQAGQTARFTGIVRDFQQRQDRSLGNTDLEEEIWHFRIERYDANGNRLTPIPVEMTGLSFVGALSNGDHVTVEGKWREGTLRVEEVANLTTNARVRAKSYRQLRMVLGVVVIFFFVVIVVIILSNVISMCSSPWPPELP
ncbi:hypothetical protein ACNF49_39465 [Actinomadura sp. ATCC 39365]